MASRARWVWYPLGQVWGLVRRNGKRISVTIVGGAFVLAGLVMLVLPGPGVVVIIAGLGVLASEYVWAERALNYAKRRAAQTKERAKRAVRRR